MPTPNPDETEEDYVKRCVPVVIEEGTAADGAQAAAICHSMYAEHKAKAATQVEPKAEATPPAEPEALRKAFSGKAITVDMDKRTVRHWITTIDLDDHGEVLLPKGVDMSRFLKTRTVFDGHEYKSRSIVGRNIDFQVTEKGILGSTRFTPRPPNHPKEQEWYPDTLLWLHHSGDLSGWSVGFDPIERRAPTVKDRMDFGAPDPERLRQVHSKWRMLEYSVAPVPVNAEARNLALFKGWISPRLAGWLEEGRLPCELQTAKSVKHVIIVPRGPTVRDQIEEAARVAVAKKLGRMRLD